MLIGGFQKFSLIDYPDKISAIIFTQGCPFKCHFCHNPDLVLKKRFKTAMSEEKVLDFLKNRKNQLDAIVITGGEPTIQKDLALFIKKVKDLNYLVKLDTSGINPRVLENLINQNLLDYIAMDIKAPLEKYKEITRNNVNLENIKKSIQLIMSSNIAYEFRTTLVKDLHSADDPIKISKLIEGASKYILQRFRPDETLDPFYMFKKPFSDSTLKKAQKEILKNVKVCLIR